MVSIHIQAQQVLVQQPPARGIHPDIEMNNPEFLKGYTNGLKNSLYPDLAEDEKALTDEDLIEMIQGCVTQEPELLPYFIGNAIGLIIARCH